MSATLQPTANPVGPRYCDLCDGAATRAVVDAQIRGLSSWGYLCLEHLRTAGTTNPKLITNITSEPLTLPWISS